MMGLNANNLQSLFGQFNPTIRSARPYAPGQADPADRQGLRDLLKSYGVSGKDIAPGQLKKQNAVAVPQDTETQKADAEKERLATVDDMLGGQMSDMLKGFGLDALDLDPDTAFNLKYSRSQFEINYQSFRAINTANGMQTEKVNFSFKASFEQLQVMAGGEAIDPSRAAEGEEVDPMARLKEFFSPEKTAERILDFALSYFPLSEAYKEGGDTEDARQNFADFIGGAIQRGFDEAMGILGQLPDKVQEDIDKTHEIIFDGLDDFVKNGLPEDKTGENGAYARIDAYRMEMSMSLRVETTEMRYFDEAADKTPVDAQQPQPGKALDLSA